MVILGLDPGAQIIILQALATYAGIASSFFFARPVLMGQSLQSHRDLLSSVRSPEKGVQDVFASALDVLNKEARENQPKTQSDNRRGAVLLAVSLLLFTSAVALQVGQATTSGTPAG